MSPERTQCNMHFKGLYLNITKGGKLSQIDSIQAILLRLYGWPWANISLLSSCEQYVENQEQAVLFCHTPKSLSHIMPGVVTDTYTLHLHKEYSAKKYMIHSL